MARHFPNVGFPRFPRTSTDVLLVRHGESQAAVEGRLFPSRDGHGDPELTELGHAQAAKLADRLGAAHVRAVYVSTLRRTHQTAAPLAAALGLDVAEVPDLREVHLGEWEGGVYRQMAADGHPAFVDHLVRGSWDPIPGAEGDFAFRARVREALLATARRHAGEQIVVVTHGGVIGALVAEATGSERTMATIVDQTSITRIVVVGERLLLRTLNDTAHLGDHIRAQVWLDAVDS